MRRISRQKCAFFICLLQNMRFFDWKGDEANGRSAQESRFLRDASYFLMEFLYNKNK